MPRTYKIAWIVCVLLALVAIVVGPLVAIRVLASSDASRQRDNDRITSLQHQITKLSKQATDAATLAAQLRVVVDALSDQIRQLGGQPVVTPAPAASPTTSTTTSTTQPTPPTTLCKVSIQGKCTVP